MVIEAIPGAQFVLEVSALLAIPGTAVAYPLKDRNPDLEVGRVVALVSLSGVLLGVLAQGVALIT